MYRKQPDSRHMVVLRDTGTVQLSRIIMCRFPKWHHLALCGIHRQHKSPQGGHGMDNQFSFDFEQASTEEDDQSLDHPSMARPSEGPALRAPAALRPLLESTAPIP